jgi:hypothetical protein
MGDRREPLAREGGSNAIVTAFADLSLIVVPVFGDPRSASPWVYHPSRTSGGQLQ